MFHYNVALLGQDCVATAVGPDIVVLLIRGSVVLRNRENFVIMGQTSVFVMDWISAVLICHSNVVSLR